MTPEQINTFRQRAKNEIGLSDFQIESYLQSKGVAGQSFSAGQPLGAVPNQRGLLQKTAGFLGIEKAGQGLASAGRVASGAINQTGNESGRALQDTQSIIQKMRLLPLGSPERRRLADYLKRSMGDQPVAQEEIDPGTALSNREVIGSFGNVGLNAAMPGAFKGGFRTVLAKNAGLGSGYGVAGGLNDNKKGTDLLKTGVVGAAAGAALPVAGKLLSSVTQKTFPSIARKLEQANLRLTPVQKQKLGKELNEVTEFLAEKKLIGTPERRFNKIDKLYDQYEDKLQKGLNNVKVGYKKDALLKRLEGLKANPKYRDDRDYDLIQKQIDGAIDLINRNYSDVIPLSRLNNLKRSTYKSAYNKAGDKVSDEIEHDIADVLRTAIEKGTDKAKLTIDGKPVGEFNKEYGKLIKGRKLLKIAETRNQLGLIGKLVSSFAGFSIGNSVSPGIGAAVGSVAGPKVGELVAGTPTRSLIGAGFKRGSKIGTGRTGRLIKRVGRQAVLNTQ